MLAVAADSVLGVSEAWGCEQAPGVGVAGPAGYCLWLRGTPEERAGYWSIPEGRAGYCTNCMVAWGGFQAAFEKRHDLEVDVVQTLLVMKQPVVISKLKH